VLGQVFLFFHSSDGLASSVHVNLKSFSTVRPTSCGCTSPFSALRGAPPRKPFFRDCERSSSLFVGPGPPFFFADLSALSLVYRLTAEGLPFLVSFVAVSFSCFLPWQASSLQARRRRHMSLVFSLPPTPFTSIFWGFFFFFLLPTLPSWGRGASPTRVCVLTPLDCFTFFLQSFLITSTPRNQFRSVPDLELWTLASACNSRYGIPLVLTPGRGVLILSRLASFSTFCRFVCSTNSLDQRRRDLLPCPRILTALRDREFWRAGSLTF